MASKIPAVLGDFHRDHPETPMANSSETRLFEVFDSSRYKAGTFEYEYDYLKGHRVHEITLLGCAEATTGRFVCTEAEGRGLAWDIECWQRWEDLKNAYRVFSNGDMPSDHYKRAILWFEYESVQHGERGINRIWAPVTVEQVNKDLERLAEDGVEWLPQTIQLGALAIQLSWFR